MPEVRLGRGVQVIDTKIVVQSDSGEACCAEVGKPRSFGGFSLLTVGITLQAPSLIQAPPSPSDYAAGFDWKCIDSSMGEKSYGKEGATGGNRRERF